MLTISRAIFPRWSTHDPAGTPIYISLAKSNVELTPRQHRALCSICDTFLPAAPGWPSAVQRGVPDALALALDFNPRAVDRWEFLNLLDLWDSSIHSFVEAGHWAQFSELAEEDKYQVMLSWAD